MAKTDHFLAETARVDDAAIQALPGSRKVHVEGSRPDIRVPFREISLSPTRTSGADEANPPLLVYDTSGPYTDPDARIDLRRGLLSCVAPGSTNAATPSFSTGQPPCTVSAGPTIPCSPRCAST